MTLLTKDDILSADDIKYEDVSVPEWGGAVRVSMMTGAARDEYEQIIVNQRAKDKTANLANIWATMLAATIIDDEGKLLFSATDITALGEKSVAALQRVFDVAARLNALRDEDIEELAGNSDAAPNGDSISD